MIFDKLTRPKPGKAPTPPQDAPDPDIRLVEAVYRGLLNKPPDPRGVQLCLTALNSGVSWEKFLSSILLWHEFDPPYLEFPDRLFRMLVDERENLERLDADITIPLHAGEGVDRPLVLRGPVRDASVFSSIIYAGGTWEPNVTRFVVDSLQAGDVFVDVGANLGYFTVLAASLTGPAGRVVSFEPAAENLDYLEQNIRLNGLGNVQLFPYGLWNRRTTLSMLAPHDFLGGAYLQESPAGPALDAPAAGGDPSDGEAAGSRVACVALDEMIATGELELDSCKAIKIDIEGSEPFALEGMSQTLQRLQPLVIVEINPHCLEFFNLTPAATWDRLRALDYDLGVLPRPEQEGALSRLPVHPAFGGHLRKLESISTLTDALEQCSVSAPAWFDVVGIPHQTRS